MSGVLLRQSLMSCINLQPDGPCSAVVLEKYRFTLSVHNTLYLQVIVECHHEFGHGLLAPYTNHKKVIDKKEFQQRLVYQN